ncbi:uncharacterized protein LOC111134449 isoform X4 [Crassostrea virginica]
MEADRGNHSDENGRETPKESFEMPMRTDTPGPLPKYMYSRDKLMELSTSKLAKERPFCLSKDHFSPEGIWEPERWFRSFDTSRGNSPLTVGDKKRPPELDKEHLNRRRPSDPKERLKDDKDGIVLSPQRRSFGTGCHVSSHVPLGRQISIPGQENGENRDRSSRRIGSGRIQIDRDREREPAHQERDFRAIRDRFDREDRRYDNRENRNFGRREFEDRNYRERGHYNNRNRRDSYRSRDEEEPEWFTEGPTSQHERIELHGFEKRGTTTPDKEDERLRQAEQDANKQEVKKMVSHKEVEEEEVSHSRESVANVTDRNGSLETNEPSSPEESNNSDSVNIQSPRHTNLFDFNEFFRLENLPGLQEGASPSKDFTGLQSRFSKWFSNSSRDNSRRSSINEDFGYLNDLLSGSKSPVISSSPPPSSANSLLHQSVFSTSANSTFQDKPQHLSYDFSTVQRSTIGPMLNALFQNSSHDRSHKSSTNSMTAQDAEAQLKALLFGRKGSTPSSSGTDSPAVASPLNLPGRFKTVAELEADMATSNRNFTPHGAPIQHHVMSQPVQRKIPRSTPPAQSPKEQQDDLTAFNKLLSLMQAGAAAAVESPNKMPQIVHHNQEQRTMSPVFSGQSPASMNSVPPQSPLTPGSVAQNEFLQALLRNKEQQLQIRQQTLNHMRGSVHLNNQSTPIAQPSQNPQQTPPSAGASQPPKNLDNSETLANFIKQNPTIITKPSTPTPPPQLQHLQPMPPSVTAVRSPLVPPPSQAAVMGLIQNTPSPRAASPQLIQQALLAQPGTPRVPSPIMFSQQPPMHLSAPSPIHPSQIAGKSSPVSMQAATNLTSTGTATIRPPVVPRVPSPQELIAHTQAIMQTALLKKQLEDQKERFMKKQQERGKSPNPPALQGKSPATGQPPCPTSPCLLPSGPSPASGPPQAITPLSNPALQSMPVSKPPSVSASFTPTSVIRKMHSDKASEKEKQKTDGLRMDGADGDKKAPPVKQLMKPEEGRDMHADEIQKQDHNVFDFRTLTQHPGQVSQSSSHPTISMAPSTVSLATSQAAINSHNHMPNLNIPPPSLSSQSGPPSLHNPNSPQFSRHNSIDQQQMTAADQVAAIQAMLAADRLKQARPVMGTPLSSSAAMQSAGRPIVKGVNMTSALPQQNPAQLNKMMSPQMSNPGLVKADLQTPPQRPIIGTGATPISTSSVELSKVLQHRHVISPNPLTHPSVGTPQGLPMGIPITGRLPLQPPSVSVSHNPLLMQQVIPGTTVRVNTLNQISHLNQMAMQAQHQRIVDPRLQGIRGMYTPPVSGGGPRGMGSSAMMNRTLTPVKQDKVS